MRTHAPIMALAILALLAGMWAGLLRLGWLLPVIQPTLPLFHGPLMVSGFLGTLIALERAVALGSISPSSITGRLPVLSPILSGLGALWLVFGLSVATGQLSLTLGSAVFVGASVLVIRRHNALHTWVMALGGVGWFVGNFLWLGGTPVPRLILWWMAFPVLTILGERLELARLLRLSNLERMTFAGFCGALCVGLLVSLVSFDLGIRIAGIGMVALSAWLFRFDLAARTIRAHGTTRFIAACMLSGYSWLGLAGILATTLGGTLGGAAYDAFLHTIFLGFVFSMIFGHAPIIIPAVLGKPITFHNRFYAHLGLLHLSLIARVAGDLIPSAALRQWGGLFNAIALVAFLANTVGSLMSRENPQ